MDLIDLVRFTDRWLEFSRAAINIRVPSMRGDSGPSEDNLAS